MASLLVACGGAEGDHPGALQRALQARRQALQAPASLPGTEGRKRALSTSAGMIDVEALLNWAEGSYAELFPKGPSTQRLTAGGVAYQVRYYPGTGNYVGVADDGGVWGYGPFTGNTLKSYGRMAEYACLVSPRLCEQTTAACKTEITTGFTGDLNATYLDAGGAADGSSADGGSAGVGGSEGKVLGGRIRVTRLSDGVVLGEGTTDSTRGLTTIKWCKADMPVMLELRGAPGAKYYDEAVNDLVEFPLTQKLRALVDRFDENVGVSALTEAAYLYAMNNVVNEPNAIATGSRLLVTDGVPLAMTSAQVQQVNALVLAEVNRLFADSLQQASMKALASPVDQNSQSSALPSNRYGRLAALTGGFAKIAASYLQSVPSNIRASVTRAKGALSTAAADTPQASAVAPALVFSRQFAQDFTDGRINGFDLQGQNIADLSARAFNSTRISENWTLGEGLMSSQFGVESTLRGTEDFIATTIAAGYLGDCPSEKSFGTYYLGKSGVVVEVFKSPASCRDDGAGYYFYNKNFLSQVRSLSDYHVSRGAFAIMLNGNVSSWGDNRCGGLGLPADVGIYNHTPHTIQGLSSVVQITAVGGAMFALTADGDVYAWGQNYANIFDFMGLPFDGVCEVDLKSYGYFSKPRKIEQLKRIKFLSGGGYFALIAVDVDGKVTTVSQLISLPASEGGGTVTGLYTLPRPVAGTVKVEPLAYATIALKRDGTVWAWLNNAGVPIDALYGWENIGVDAPMPLKSVGNIVDIITDARQNLLISLDSSGRVSIHSASCRDRSADPPFPYNYITLNRETVPASRFPAMRRGVAIDFPRAVRLSRINDSVAFIGADGETYALDTSGLCDSWVWISKFDERLADLLRNDGAPVPILPSVSSANCHLRPTDYLCQEFNGRAEPYKLTDQNNVVSYSIEKFVSSDASDALYVSNNLSNTFMEYDLSSRFPRSGTMELRVLVEQAVERYRYPFRGGSQGSFDGCAPLLLSDWKDVPWPGSTWFYACANGTVRLEMSLQKGSSSRQVLQAENTAFRFRKWVRLGFSYGQFGQIISVDGKVVAANLLNTQTLGSGGNDIQPRNKLTLGFYRSEVAGRDEGGFVGAVDWFRVSNFPNDWIR